MVVLAVQIKTCDSFFFVLESLSHGEQSALFLLAVCSKQLMNMLVITEVYHPKENMCPEHLMKLLWHNLCHVVPLTGTLLKFEQTAIGLSSPSVQQQNCRNSCIRRNGHWLLKSLCIEKFHQILGHPCYNRLILV